MTGIVLHGKPSHNDRRLTLASEMLIAGMKLGRCWLYVLWIASTVLWHQAGAASPSAASFSTSARWVLADDDAPQPAADLTALQGTTASLEDQLLTKKTSAAAAFIGQIPEFQTPDFIVVGTDRNERPQGVSATWLTARLIRGPPPGA